MLPIFRMVYFLNIHPVGRYTSRLAEDRLRGMAHQGVPKLGGDGGRSIDVRVYDRFGSEAERKSIGAKQDVDRAVGTSLVIRKNESSNMRVIVTVEPH